MADDPAAEKGYLQDNELSDALLLFLIDSYLRNRLEPRNDELKLSQQINSSKFIEKLASRWQSSANRSSDEVSELTALVHSVRQRVDDAERRFVSSLNELEETTQKHIDSSYARKLVTA
jgi:hypothetical protein